MAVTNYYTVGGAQIAEETGGARSDYHLDALGSITAQTDSTQAVTAAGRYAAYGWTYWSNAAQQSAKYSWCGSWGYRKTQTSTDSLRHAENYVRARHYSMTTSRWTTVDPILASQAYLYATGNPITLVDVDGRRPSPPSSGKAKKPKLPKTVSDCLGAAAKNLLSQKFANKACATAIKRLCDKGGFDALNDKKIVPAYEVKDICSDANPNLGGRCKITLPTLKPHTPPPYAKGTPCKVLSVCFKRDLCHGTGQYEGAKNLPAIQACTVIWELGNACSCKKYGYDPDEKSAQRLVDACGCHGVVGPGGAYHIS